MNCKDCADRLSPWLDRELSEDEARTVEAHLAGCAACRKEQAALERLAAGVRALPRHVPGIACALKLGEQIHARAPGFRPTAFGPVLDMDELAQFLRVDRAVIGEYLDDIPSFELGGMLLFRRKRVEAWIESREMCRGRQGKETADGGAPFGVGQPTLLETGGVGWKN